MRSCRAELLQAAKETVTKVPQIPAASLSLPRLQSTVQSHQGAFPLWEITDVPPIAETSRGPFSEPGCLMFSGCLLTALCRQTWVICSLSLLCIDTPGAVPPFACVHLPYSAQSSLLPQCLSDTCMELAAKKESQQTWEMKGRRNRGSLDELVAIQCQAAEASLWHRSWFALAVRYNSTPEL